MYIGKRVSEPSEWWADWIQRVGHLCHRQEHDIDGKVDCLLDGYCGLQPTYIKLRPMSKIVNSRRSRYWYSVASVCRRLWRMYSV